MPTEQRRLTLKAGHRRVAIGCSAIKSWADVHNTQPAAAAGGGGALTMMHGDFFDVSLAGYNVVFLGSLCFGPVAMWINGAKVPVTVQSLCSHCTATVQSVCIRCAISGV